MEVPFLQGRLDHGQCYATYSDLYAFWVRPLTVLGIEVDYTLLLTTLERAAETAGGELNAVRKKLVHLVY